MEQFRIIAARVMKKPACLLMVFVDGLGVGSSDPSVNPVHSGCCPVISDLLRRHRSIDACLGVPGLPQSATGQTTLLTGVNAAVEVGRHVEGFPGPSLRRIIEEHNIYKQLARQGRVSTFANAYFVDEIEEVTRRSIQSVTTVAAMSAFGRVRGKDLLASNQAVYQDITREALVARGYTGPLVTPAEAAEHLVGIAAQQDLTLFEYFQTDRAGHSGDRKFATAILAILDALLGQIMTHVGGGHISLVLTSDHGNIENMTTTRHTMAPVPFVAEGGEIEYLAGRVKSLTDVTPAIVEWMGRVSS